ncbi:CHAT domain-containing tetratricopeptide repeat protein, partial [Archangium sp.]|uniref:CHAT domain-containing tetratricopeptide repeat protein n=1 Tax=Archangium sp. TaxID=1872627 RepID=UPI00286A7BA4
ASLNNHAKLYIDQGHYGRAEPLYARALAIREGALGKDHPDVAASLNNLATLYRDQGHYGRAEPLYARALAIRDGALGKDDPKVASSLNNLAILYRDQGQYGRAEPLYERALAIGEGTLGKNHPDVARSLNNLANLYYVQGHYGRAEPLYERALAIREGVLGKDHPDVATSLNNLASLYYVQGQYGRAETLYERALAIREGALGKDHPDVAASLNNLAILYRHQGHYGRAEPLLERALAVMERALGKDHPDVASLLHSLANLYSDQGQYGHAEPLLERALAIWEGALGKDHPDVTISLKDLAVLRFAQHHLAESLSLYERAFFLSEQHLRQEVFGFSEARLTSVLQLLRAEEERLYALARAHPDQERIRHLALTAALLRKNRSAEEIAATSRIIYRGLGPEDRETFERLRALRTHRSMLSLAGPGRRSPENYQQRLKELADQGDALEAELARRSEPLRALHVLPPPAEFLERVAAVLPKDGALVEFVAYNDRPIVPRSGTFPNQRPSDVRYLALLLFADGHTHIFDLGPAAPIDSAASRLRDALASGDVAYQQDAQAFYKRVFRPLVPLLGKTRRLFLSPDGQLALVPFAALHDGKRFLVDAFDIIHLTSGKDLLRRPEAQSSARSVVVLADPDFGATPTASSLTQEGSPAMAQRLDSVERIFSALRSELPDTAWQRLPGTRKEAEAIKRLFPQAQLLLDGNATKDALLKLETPGLLHIATHGFFLAAPADARLEEAAAPGDTRKVGNLGAIVDAGPNRSPDPLLRSGLVLAGGNALAAQSGSSRMEDSLVTALELAGLDLWGTQLVVLSACDTGRGDVMQGQGVYGLRRALVVAGAETVVTSLWQVNDETTRELMEAYYDNLLAGQGRAEALRRAMRALRQKKPHPKSWAAFIAIGQDAPLRGLVLGTVEQQRAP